MKWFLIPYFIIFLLCIILTVIKICAIADCLQNVGSYKKEQDTRLSSRLISFLSLYRHTSYICLNPKSLSWPQFNSGLWQCCPILCYDLGDFCKPCATIIFGPVLISAAILQVKADFSFYEMCVFPDSYLWDCKFRFMQQIMCFRRIS